MPTGFPDRDLTLLMQSATGDLQAPSVLVADAVHRAQQQRKRRVLGLGGMSTAVAALTGAILIQGAGPTVATIPAEVRTNHTAVVAIDCRINGEGRGVNSGSPTYARDGFTKIDPVRDAARLAEAFGPGSRLGTSMTAVVRPESSGRTVLVELNDGAGIRRGVFQYYGDGDGGWQAVHLTYC